LWPGRAGIEWWFGRENKARRDGDRKGLTTG
jgi:hypothetical protein